MDFLNSGFLIGLLAAFIPLLIHLSRSKKSKRMQFSTTQFFTQQFLRSYRRSRIKEWLLLALRMALCALFALALAQPLLKVKGHSILAQGGRRSVVLVLDNSASMSYREDRGVLFERCRLAADQILGSLDSGDTAALVLAGRRASGPEVLFARPTEDLQAVRDAVDRLQPEALGTDLKGALAAASGLFSASSAKNREIYLLSDLQTSGWDLSEGRPIDPHVQLFFVSIRPKEPENAGVAAIQYASARPMVGVPFAIRALVRNEGAAARSTDIRLVVDGVKVGEHHATIQANRGSVERFHHSFAKGGWHTGYVEIDGDRMPLDDRRSFAVNVQDSIKVLAVDGAPSSVPRLDELFFLRTALTSAPQGESPVRLDVTTPATLGENPLDQYPLIILANVAKLPDALVEKLEQYVDTGGSLFVFLGDKVDRDFYNQTLAGGNHLHGGLAPGRLLDLEGKLDGPEDFAYISGVDYDHPALASFQDPKFGSLGSVKFRALYGIEAAGGTVLMRASTGGPLLIEKGFGQGRVMLFASTADRDWTNFAVRPAYLPWVYRLVSYLAQQRLGRQPFYATGDRVPVPLPAGAQPPQLQVVRPDKSLGHVVAAEQPDQYEFADTIQPGVYRIRRAGSESDQQVFAANLDADETQMDFLTEERLKTLLPEHAQLTFIAAPEGILAASNTARRGIGLWDYALFAALLIALFEPWFANRISARHYGKPDELPESLTIPGRLARAPAPAGR